MKEKNTNSKYIFALGRRKEGRASIMLFEGQGENLVNGKNLNEYFPLKVDQVIALRPLKLLELDKSVYFTAKVVGGGKKGIRDAISLGISRALIKKDVEYKKVLRKEGLLTRDDRIVERKHTGFVKARKRPQYSKR